MLQMPKAAVAFFCRKRLDREHTEDYNKKENVSVRSKWIEPRYSF